MSKVLLVGLNTRHTHSSLSLAMLQAFWEKTPSNPRLKRIDFDLNQGNDSIIQNIILQKPNLVAFSVYIWNLISTLTISGAIKAAFPETKIIFGGPEVSFGVEEIFRTAPWVDLIAIGEGEETFSEILRNFFNGKELIGIAGTAYSQNGNPFFEPSRDQISNLDIIPSPFKAGLYGNGRGFTYYEASRGCPFKCTYCLSSVLGPVRNFSMERVFEDLDWFFNSDYTQIRFADRTFNLDTERAASIIQYILDRNHKKICFHFELKADILNDDLIDLLAGAPKDTFHLEIGVQSTNSAALGAVSRKSDLEKLSERVFRLREKTGCHIHIDLLAGLPGENFDLFKKTLNDAFSWKTSSIQVGLVKVLKGTALNKFVESGELSSAPYPPYAIQRSNWLEPHEIVKIQDIGKLVEGICNTQRFRLSLNFLCQRFFNGNQANFYESLALFWRRNDRQFYGLNPEFVKKTLMEFLETLTNDNFSKNSGEALMTHEFRMCQKVPAGKQGQMPHLPNLSNRPLGKKASGFKVFWYPVDIQILLSEEENTSITSGTNGTNYDVKKSHPIGFPSPLIYSYQTDLSLPPNSKVNFLPIEERFVMALCETSDSILTITSAWNNQGRISQTNYFFQNALDNLVSKELVIIDSQKSGKSLKKPD
ncbi:MAG: DUF4080 domain-containing protein [Candidatus Riflebacteria bacterium]|nr:DUF4080 domain-containing protein [Candidatus Riflebacteria bacterium]